MTFARYLSGAAVLVSVASACSTTKMAPIAPHQPEPIPAVMTPAAIVPPAPTLRDIVRAIVDSATKAPMWQNARWGILLVDAASGDTLASHDADRLFMPASNQKLLTAAIAVQQLGLDYRWRTPVLLRGAQRGHTWMGDVLVAGSGDPSVSDAMRGDSAAKAFDPILEALHARGITRIVGDVLPYGDAFAGPTSGFGWAIDDQDAEYGAAVDELMFNEGLLRIRVHGGAKAGAPVRVQRAPTSAYPPIVLRAETRDSVARRDRVRAEYDSIGAALVVSGAIAVGDSALLELSYRHPADAYMAALRERLTSGGVRVRAMAPSQRRTFARTVARDSARGKGADTLLVLESPPLRNVLPRMQKPSQNQIAELFFRTTGRAVSGDGSADSARAVGARVLATFGIGPTEIAYRDGSGLSRHDYLTPRAVIKVLDAMRRAPTFDVYRDALPIAGVDGTIANRMKGTPAQGNARAKTGTLDKTRALSGYVTTADGRLVMFSMQCNNFTVPNREVERVQDLLVTTVAGFRAASDSGSRGR